MFGLSSSVDVFSTIGDMLVTIYEKAGFSPIIKWVNDFFATHHPGQVWMEQDFVDLTGYFGVPWSMKKMRPLATVQRYIGFNWDLNACTMALPAEK